RSRPRALRDLEGHDPLSADEAGAIGAREATRQGPGRGGAREGEERPPAAIGVNGASRGAADRLPRTGALRRLRARAILASGGRAPTAGGRRGLRRAAPSAERARSLQDAAPLDPLCEAGAAAGGGAGPRRRPVAGPEPPVA